MIPREKTTLTKWDTPGEKVFYAVNAAALSLLMIACIYPILCIISGAISDPAAVSNGRVTFYPIGFSLEGFRLVLKDNALITGFLNTVFYTVVGTVLNVFVTVITAYSLSRRELIGRGVISFFFAFTMWFSGGIIPFYLLVKQLGMMNTRWALIIPGLMSVWSMIVCRTFIASTIPEDIFEASSIDGCGYFRYFFLMVLPLSKAILAVLSLWYAIGHWN
ncbi:MAG: carbohydrate ABC transporter permease, partial [Clostridia bacterium]